MLNGLDSGTHLTGLFSPILSPCTWPNVKPQQLSGVFNTKVCPFWDITPKPLRYVLLTFFHEIAEQDKDTLRWLKFQSSKLLCTVKYGIKNLEVFETSKGDTNVIRTSSTDATVGLP